MAVRWVFARDSYEELERQRHYIALGEERPVRWEGFLADTIAGVTGYPVACVSRRALLDPKCRLFAWNPSREAFLFALTDRLAYIAWGTRGRTTNSSAARNVLRLTILKLLLRRARPLFVNEAVTATEIENLVGRTPLTIPYFIDTDFWTFREAEGRESFLFCPSTNDRDGAVLVDLARRGHPVVWLVNDAGLRERYAGTDPNLTLIKEISYVHMRTLYHTCRAVVLPLARDLHAAGQTTSLEAIACGAPVYLSEGRTATIFRHLPSVTIAGPADWRNETFAARMTTCCATSSAWLRERHLPALHAALAAVLGNP